MIREQCQLTPKQTHKLQAILTLNRYVSVIFVLHIFSCGGGGGAYRD